jgi:hypothetical protein
MPTPLQGFTTFDNSLSPLGGTEIATVSAQIEKRVVMRFANVADRDAKIPSSAREKSMACILDDQPGVLYVCDASGSSGVWQAETPPITLSTYTPSFSSTGSAPVMLAGNRVGRYRQVGKRVEGDAKLLWTSLGTGEGLGTGSYLFSLPVAASSWYPTGFPLGMGAFLDSGLFTYVGGVHISSTTQVFLELANAAGKASNSIPVAPTNADSYYLTFAYFTD